MVLIDLKTHLSRGRLPTSARKAKYLPTHLSTNYSKTFISTVRPNTFFPPLVLGPAWSWARLGPGPGLVPGPWSLVRGPWSLVPWSLVPGPWSWSWFHGPWSLVLGPGPMVPGPGPGPWSRSVVPGPWPMVRGPGPWSVMMVALASRGCAPPDVELHV